MPDSPYKIFYRANFTGHKGHIQVEIPVIKYIYNLGFDDANSPWPGGFGGRIGVEKDPIRLKIENILGSMSDMPELTNRYSVLIDQARRGRA
jgi:hypothetical protein